MAGLTPAVAMVAVATVGSLVSQCASLRGPQGDASAIFRAGAIASIAEAQRRVAGVDELTLGELARTHDACRSALQNMTVWDASFPTMSTVQARYCGQVEREFRLRFPGLALMPVPPVSPISAPESVPPR